MKKAVSPLSQPRLSRYLPVSKAFADAFIDLFHGIRKTDLLSRLHPRQAIACDCTGVFGGLSAFRTLEFGCKGVFIKDVV
jgi:hypothetical protein